MIRACLGKLILLSLLVIPHAHADSLHPIQFTGTVTENNGLKLESLMGSIEEGQDDEVIEAMAAQMAEDYRANPQMSFEIAYVDGKSGRDPSADLLTRTQALAAKLKERLATTGASIRSGGMTIRKRAVEWTFSRSPAFWNYVRMGTSTSINVGMFIFVKDYSLLASVIGGGAVLGASFLAANFSNQLNDFQGSGRLWNLLPSAKARFNRELEAAKADGSVNVEVVADEAHGLVNFGLSEVAFGATLVGIRNGFFNLLSISHQKFSLGEFSEGILYSTISQGIWERAINKYKELLILRGYSTEQINKMRKPLAAFGSVLSVSGFTTMEAINPLAGKIILGVLGVSGLVYGQYINKQIVKELAKAALVNPCDLLMDGNLGLPSGDSDASLLITNPFFASAA